MARETYQQLVDRGVRSGGSAALLAILGSAQNPDGSPFSLPVDAVLFPADRHESTSVANGVALITWAAVAGQSHHLTALEASYSVATATGLLSVEEGAGSTVRARIEVVPRLTVQWAVPLKFAANTVLVVRLPAGGPGSVGRLSIHGFTR